jgi:hypothetical protein
MHSASSRFNSITLFTASVLAVMALVNFLHGYYVFNPKVDVVLNIRNPSNFVDTKFWDQAAIRYDLYAGRQAFTQTSPPFTRGTSSSSTRTSSSTGSTPTQK